MLKSILENLDGLSADVAAEYTETGGKFRLQVEGVDGFALEDVGGLKKALTTERGNASTYAKQLKAFEGLDATKAREAIEAMELGGAKNDEETKTLLDNMKKQLGDKHGLEITALDAKMANMKKQLVGGLVDGAASKAFAKLGGNAELLMPHITSQTEVREVDGVFQAVVIDKEGNPRISSKAGSTGNMSVGELVESMRGNETFAGCFKGSGATGGGANGNAGGGANGNDVVLTKEQYRDTPTFRAATERATKAGGKVVMGE